MFVFVPEFLAKTQKHAIPNSGFEWFTVLSVHDFLVLTRMKFYCAWHELLDGKFTSLDLLASTSLCPLVESRWRSTEIQSLFGWGRESVTSIALLLLLTRFLFGRLRAHEMHSIAPPLLFKSNFVITRYCEQQFGSHSLNLPLSVFRISPTHLKIWWLQNGSFNALGV